jgi:hypothetical protein
MDVIEGSKHGVVGGVDTHKDLHVAAVVDERDRVLETRSFATTRQGYRQMLVWLRVPLIATTRSGGSRPPIPIDRDQCGAERDGAVGCMLISVLAGLVKHGGWSFGFEHLAGSGLAAAGSPSP